MPERDQSELREMNRYRASLVQEHTAEVNRLLKVLEGANIKLAAVTSDVLGKSGRGILEALVGGSLDAAAMAQLAKGRMHAKIPELEQALVGRFAAHQRFLVAHQLAHLDFLDETIERVGAEIAVRLRPLEEAIERLDTTPGVNRRTADALVAEIGTDMSRFPSADHMASWSGMVPGNNESAGIRSSGTTRKGSNWLRSALVEMAHAAGRSKDSYLGS